MRVRAAAAGAAILVAWSAASPAAAGAPGVVRISGPSPFPEKGCGQINPSPAQLASGEVSLFDPERGQESDLSVVVNPTNPRNIIAAWVQDAALGIVAGSSFDGGRTWRRVVVPGITVCSGGPAQHVMHARLAVGPEGRLYVAGETLDGFFPDPRSGQNGIPVSTSADGGRTWSSARFLPVEAALNGFDTITAEPDRRGTVVIAWHAPEPASSTFLSRSTDGGATWARLPVPVPQPDSLPTHRVVAGRDGRLHLLTVEATLRSFAGAGPAALVARSSNDKGRSWSSPSVVDSAVPDQWVGGAAGADGRLTAVWRDEDGACADALLTASSTRGRAWTKPVTIACGIVGAEPSLAARPDGALAVAATVNLPGGRQQQRMFTSRDGYSWHATSLGTAFAMPAYVGFFQETALGPANAYSVFLRSGEGANGPSDVYLGVSGLGRRR